MVLCAATSCAQQYTSYCTPSWIAGVPADFSAFIVIVVSPDENAADQPAPKISAIFISVSPESVRTGLQYAVPASFNWNVTTMLSSAAVGSWNANLVNVGTL